MKAIEAGVRFKKDYARWIKGTPLEAEFADLLRTLASGSILAASQRDHSLQGPWRGCRDCDLLSHVVLIYERS